MTDAASDERAYDAKIAILEAMSELCKTRPFSRLGVVEIAKQAGISRSSFYYHFSDRNDAVQWLSNLAFARGIDRIGRGLSWYEGHLATTRMLVRFKPLIVAASEDAGYSGAQLFFLRHRKANLCETMRIHGVEPTDELMFQAEALAASEQYMTVAYIKGMFGSLAPQAFCELLEGIVPAALRAAVESPSAD